ncbi:MAG TPA: hypothetical protein VEI02_05590 [Planctomycetota bacterium]|nr:hypothetical protein [Planctomycetota bacterium]
MHFRKAYRDGSLRSFRNGTAFPNFDVYGALNSTIVALPPDSIAEEFSRTLSLAQRIDLSRQNQTLSALRDTLLPKLISGELRVKEAERFVEAAT